jgi:hypothetical protein
VDADIPDDNETLLAAARPPATPKINQIKKAAPAPEMEPDSIQDLPPDPQEPPMMHEPPVAEPEPAPYEEPAEEE